jgi:hypothetical protein
MQAIDNLCYFHTCSGPTLWTLTQVGAWHACLVAPDSGSESEVLKLVLSRLCLYPYTVS